MDVRRYDPDLNPETPGKEAKHVHLHKSPGRVHCGGGRQRVANLHHEAVNCRSIMEGTIPSKLILTHSERIPQNIYSLDEKNSVYSSSNWQHNFFIFITYQ